MLLCCMTAVYQVCEQILHTRGYQVVGSIQAVSIYQRSPAAANRCNGKHKKKTAKGSRCVGQLCDRGQGDGHNQVSTKNAAPVFVVSTTFVGISDSRECNHGLSPGTGLLMIQNRGIEKSRTLPSNQESSCKDDSTTNGPLGI